MTSAWLKLTGKLDERILSAIKEVGFENPTPVQAACIPLMLERKDVVTEAVTGSGKTLAYLIPLIQTILNVEREEKALRSDAVYAIVILPTRELAAQVYAVLGTFLKHAPTITSALLTSGKNRNITEQSRRIASGGTHVLVSTPGRLLTFLEVSGEANLLRKVKLLELLVLDEADRLLELGFYETLQRIVTTLPKQRRTSLFSATQTGDVEQLIRAGLRNPVRVTVRDKPVAKQQRSTAKTTEKMDVDEPVAQKPAGNDQQPQDVASTQAALLAKKADADGSRVPTCLRSFYMTLEHDAKLPMIEAFIRHHPEAKVLIFTATCLCATFVHTVLRTAFRRRAEFIMRLHRKTHSKRDAVLRRFAEARRGAVLICTDVLARGIDVPDVDWVIQMDAPSQARTYVHRAGRTARCGRAGSSLLLLAPTESAYLRFLNINQQVALTPFQPDFVLPTSAKAVDAATKAGKEADTKKQDGKGNVLERCSQLVREDPLMRLRAIRAFTSYIRFYSKHEAHLIFRLRDLAVDALARSFGLRHIPKMPELSFWRSKTVNADTNKNTAAAGKQNTSTTQSKAANEAKGNGTKANGNTKATKAEVRFRNKKDAKTYERLLQHFEEKRKRAEKRQSHASWSRSHPLSKRQRNAEADSSKVTPRSTNTARKKATA